jgi:osmotically inducible protein OsmC
MGAGFPFKGPAPGGITMPKSTAKAAWTGTLQKGNGGMKLGSGACDAPFSFGTRFQGEAGANPEELIGAALAGCFSMALSKGLADAGHEPRRIDTSAETQLDEVEDGFAITRIHLTCKADVPDIDEQAFGRIAEETKNTCPVSKALAGTSIELDAHLTAGAGA